MTGRGDGISQETEDAIVNLIMTRLVEVRATSGKTVYQEVMDSMPPGDRELVEQALDRYEVRMRAAGRPGW